MKKNRPTPLADEYINSLQGIQQVETDPFFYTRLKARMEKDINTDRGFSLKPAWLVSLLAIFVVINSYFLITQAQFSKETSSQSTPLQKFATEYDLSVSTPY